MPLTPPIPVEQASPELQALYEQVQQTIGQVPVEVRMTGHVVPFAKDMFENHLQFIRQGQGHLSDAQRGAVALAVSSANFCINCVKAHRHKCTKLGYTETQTLEIIAVAAECSMLNTLYKFRDFAAGDFADRPNPLKTQALADVTLEGLTVQLICLAVSVINACKRCVEVHTQQARDLGATTEQINEAALVASVMTAYNQFFRLQHD